MSESQDRATTKPVARKITPTASKTWKENLRRACLDRARQRQRQRQSNNNNDHKDNADEPFSNLMVMMPPVRQMVEEELRQRAIAVRAPCFSDEPAEPNNDHDMMMTDSDDKSNENVPKAQHFISEEELFELLEEINQEMEREEALLVDDMLERVENERQYLEEQVIDFQQWEEMQHHQQDDAVPCPICHEGNLMLSGDGSMIVCPNSLDGSCSLQLRSNTLNNNLQTLHDLQDKLQQTYEEHSLHCHHFLTFRSQNGRLQACCSACLGSVQLV